MSRFKENNPQKRFIFSLFIFMILAGIRLGNAGEPETMHPHNGSQTHATSNSSSMEMSDLMSRADAPDKETENAGPLMMNRLMNKSDEVMSGSGRSGLYKTSSDAHAAMEGIPLKANTNETVTAGKRCPSGAPARSFDITAINIEITMNRFLQFYPGYMYVLTENLEKAREEERKNKEARGKKDDYGSDSPGLDGGDAIQPLVIRASQGDCVIMTLHNKVDSTKDPVSLHIHGSSLTVKMTGKAAVATNPDTTVEYGKSQSYEWYITPETQEGAHMFHSHFGREQSSLGMMGVFNVEPYGSKYLDPISGKDMKSGWSAMIIDPKGPDFREFTVIYHEVGDEAFRPLEKTGELMEQRDPLIDVYRPGSRALNYRSEPHGTRLAWEKKLFGFTDESQAYGSYMFGDPATPVPRSYLGDPAKWRLVHGGS